MLANILQVAPSLLNKLPKEAFMNLRETNVFWKQQLDLAYQTHSSPETLPISKLTSKFENMGQLDEFLHDMESHPGNPLLGRSLSFLFRRHNAQEFLRKVVHLMDRFGAHVHFMNLHYEENYDPIRFKTGLNTILRTAPNLQGLTIKAVLDQLDEFRDYQDVLPKLARLKCLKVSSTTNRVIFALLSQLCDPGTLQQLTLNPWRMYYPYQNDPAAIATLATFSNLQELEVGGTHAALPYLLDYLEAAAMAGAPLKVLRFSCANGLIDVQRFICLVGNFKEFLEHLSFAANGGRFLSNEFVMNVVTFPKLKQLSSEALEEVLMPLLQRIQSPLNKLNMKMVTENLNKEVFGLTLGRFKETLKELELQIRFHWYRYDPPRVVMQINDEVYIRITANLPQLRVLKLIDVDGSLESIFQFSTLKRFHAKLVGVEYSTQAFELVERLVQESPSIWQIMSTLQEISVEGYIMIDGNKEQKTVTHVRED